MNRLYGARVTSQDGKAIGIVKELVIDPRSRVITHVVVQQGLLFNADRLIPTPLIDDAASKPGRVVLTVTAAQLEERNPPEYRTDDFVELDDQELRSSQGVGGAVWRRPADVGISDVPYPSLIPPGFAALTPEAVPVTPFEEITLEKGSPVRTADGVQIGTVSDVVADANEAITHILLGEGAIFHEPRLVPIDWVARIEENEVILAVNKAVVERLRQ